MLRRYEMPWRPVYETTAAAAWAGSSILSLGLAAATAAPALPFWFVAGLSGVMATYRSAQSWHLMTLKLSLHGRGMEYITAEELLANQCAVPDSIWLGNGFEWGPMHSQRVYEMLKVNPKDLAAPEWFREMYGAMTGRTYPKEGARGLAWIHGLEPNEIPLYVNIADLEGHTQILGTPGSGKTRLLEILVTQAIHRGDVVIVIDPKGDKDLEKRVEKEAKRANRGHQYFYFGPAFPSKSCRIDPMANFSRVTQLASRLAALVPSETGSDAFVAFSWSTINKISQALVFIDERPSIIKIRRYIEGGPEGLLVRVLETHFRNVAPDVWETEATPYVASAKKGRLPYPLLHGYIAYYREQIAESFPSEECSGLVNLFEHNREHFGKMIATLSPVLDMLTSGDLGKMLSPDAFDIDDERPIINSERIIRSDGIIYMGLDALSDKTVASAIGSMLLADYAATAGAIYNYLPDRKRITFIVDEANEVLNDPFIQLLNKGRGTGIQITMATQTVADYAAKLGSLDKAEQVMGNNNNLICMRVIDERTQKFVVGKIFGKAWIQNMQVSHSSVSQTEQAMVHFTGGIQERMNEVLEDAFPQDLLGRLPNWEYIASFSGGVPKKGRVPIMAD